MSSAIEAAFDEWLKETYHQDYKWGNGERVVARKAFAAGVSHAAKANTELIKEYQETMEKNDNE